MRGARHAAHSRRRKLAVPAAAIHRVTTERADTLQVATGDAMWQFMPDAASVFRLHHALRRWIGPCA